MTGWVNWAAEWTTAFLAPYNISRTIKIMNKIVIKKGINTVFSSHLSTILTRKEEKANVQIRCPPNPFRDLHIHYGQMTIKDVDDMVSIVPDFGKYEGMLLRAPDGTRIYLIDRNRKRWITNQPLLTGLFNAREQLFTHLGDILDGPDIDNGTALFRVQSDTKIWWLDKDVSGKIVKRHIVTPAAFAKYNFNYNSVITVPDYFGPGVQDGIAIGGPY
jgi:hypothetical protein